MAEENCNSTLFLSVRFAGEKRPKEVENRKNWTFKLL